MLLGFSEESTLLTTNALGDGTAKRQGRGSKLDLVLGEPPESISSPSFFPCFSPRVLDLFLVSRSEIRSGIDSSRWMVVSVM